MLSATLASNFAKFAGLKPLASVRRIDLCVDLSMVVAEVLAPGPGTIVLYDIDFCMDGLTPYMSCLFSNRNIRLLSSLEVIYRACL